MFNHIEFCLEELDCEIDALDPALVTSDQRETLALHIAEIRALVQGLRLEIVANRADGRDENALEDLSNESHHEPAPAPLQVDALTLIKGVDAETAGVLEQAGWRTFTAMAAWNSADLAALEEVGISKRRVARENWIEQAAILATGGFTAHAQAALSDAVDADRATPEADEADMAGGQSTGEIDAAWTLDPLMHTIAVGHAVPRDVQQDAASPQVPAIAQDTTPDTSNVIAFERPAGTWRRRAGRIAACLALALGLTLIPMQLGDAPAMTVAWMFAAL